MSVDVAAERRGAPRITLGALRDYGIVASAIVLFVAIAVASPAFLTTTNLLNVLDQWAPVGIMACASTLVVIVGGLDLSVAAIYALAGVVAAKVAVSAGVPLGLAAGIAVGAAAGVANGLLATVGRINPLVATLASGFAIRGLAIVVSGGLLVTVDDEGFLELGTGELLGVKYSVVIWLVVALVLGVLLHRTVLGRRMYAVGGNAVAARLTGIRVAPVRMIAYTLSGAAAGLAGVIVASRASTGQADAGQGIEFNVIAAIVIGGSSILGGEGAIWRTVLGVAILALIGNGFNLLGVSVTYQQMIYGGIILLAVAVDAWARRTS